MPDLSAVWPKIVGHEIEIGRAGCVPVKIDSDWRRFRNTYTIYDDSADPAKVEELRLNARDLVYLFPDTVEGLEKLGVRVKRILEHPIKNQGDVVAWAESIFNTGPTGKTEKAFSTQALAPAKVRKIRVRAETPTEPEPEPEPAEPERELLPTEKVTASGKRLGRPRKDGLLQGSPEAVEADKLKKKEYQRKRRAAASKTVATVTAITNAKPKRLIRRPKTA